MRRTDGPCFPLCDTVFCSSSHAPTHSLPVLDLTELVRSCDDCKQCHDDGMRSPIRVTPRRVVLPVSRPRQERLSWRSLTMANRDNLVRLNHARVGFVVCLGRRERNTRAGERTKSRPSERAETSCKTWCQYASKQTLEGFICGENVIRPPSDPTAGGAVLV